MEFTDIIKELKPKEILTAKGKREIELNGKSYQNEKSTRGRALRGFAFLPPLPLARRIFYERKEDCGGEHYRYGQELL